MKRLSLLFLCLAFSASVGYCQIVLGLTKEKIIEQYPDCVFAMKNDTGMLLQCPAWNRIFWFNDKGLCIVSAIDMDSILSPIFEVSLEVQDWKLHPDPNPCLPSYSSIVKIYCKPFGKNGIGKVFFLTPSKKIRINTMILSCCSEFEMNKAKNNLKGEIK